MLFESDGSLGQDRNDAEKLFSMSAGIPQIYTIINNDLKAGLNSMPLVSGDVTVPLGIIPSTEGTFKIIVNGIESFTSLTGLSLEDLKLNKTQNLLQGQEYQFTATKDEDAGRFLLHFAGTIGIDEKGDNDINIYSNEKNVFITCASGFRNADVTISNLLGQEILTQKLSDKKINQVQVNALKGYYIVKVKDESSVKAVKVYIN